MWYAGEHCSILTLPFRYGISNAAKNSVGDLVIVRKKRSSYIDLTNTANIVRDGQVLPPCLQEVNCSVKVHGQQSPFHRSAPAQVYCVSLSKYDLTVSKTQMVTLFFCSSKTISYF
jgi:hypothetical protein